MSRRPILVVVAVALAVMAVAGWRLSPGPGFAPASARSLPTVRTPAADQEWYCSTATTQAGGQAAGTLVMANSSGSALRGVATVYPNQGARPRSRSFVLAPWSRTSIKESSVVRAPFVAATVVFSGGGGSADQEVDGPLGVSVATCATRPSSSWYFATGTTQAGASLVVSLFNPFPEEALADLSFADNQGYSAPPGFQGVFVPAHTVVTVDVGQHVVLASDIATTVQVRVGRLVASELQLNAITGQSGLNLMLGAPAPSPRWYLPDGVVAGGVTETLHLYNPTARASRVSLRVQLAQGVASPFEVDLGPRSESVLDLAHQARVPPNDPYSTVVTVAGAPIVVARTVAAGPPSARRGTASMLASPSLSRAWQLGAGGVTAAQDEWVVVFDASPKPATISIAALGGGRESLVAGLARVVVPAGGRSAFRLGDHIHAAGLSLVLRSSVPVVVERDLYQIGAPGISIALGDPIIG